MTLVTDTSYIYALYNKNDSRHREAMDFALDYDGATVVPQAILPEVCHLFARDVGYNGVVDFLSNMDRLHADEPLLRVDLLRVKEISAKYRDSKLDFVDCCIMAIAERLNITRIATFDRRDFSIFQPRHCDYLELLP